jgi:hypothetical protein
MDSNPADLICHYLDLAGVQSGANRQAEGVDSVPDGQGAVDGASRAVRCREESATAPILRVDVPVLAVLERSPFGGRPYRGRLTAL